MKTKIIAEMAKVMANFFDETNVNISPKEFNKKLSEITNILFSNKQ
jgi:hypothetical protein